MSVTCDLSELVCVRIIDDMIGKPHLVIDLVSSQLRVGFHAQVVDAIFEKLRLRTTRLFFKRGGCVVCFELMCFDGLKLFVILRNAVVLIS